MKRLLLALFLFLSSLALGQGGNTLTIRFPGVPTGTCAPFFLGVNNATADLYDCTAGGAWNLVSSAGGGGTVTNIATTSPITGGPITTTGTIACATCGVTGSPLSQFASTTSSQLAGVISDETGTAGKLVFDTSPTIVTPTIASFVNATHTHANAAGGGQLGVAAVSATGTPGATTFWRGDNTWSVPAGTATAWDAITAPSGNMALSNGTNTSIFSGTAATSQFFAWKNTTAAVVGTSQGSPVLAVCGRAFHGSADVEDCMTLGELPGNGNDAAITFTIGHTGTSTGAVTTSLPGPLTLGGTPLKLPNNGNIQSTDGASIIGFSASGNPLVITNTTGIRLSSVLKFTSNDDVGLSRDAAGVLDVGTGAAASTAGRVKASGYMSVGTTFTSNAGCTDTSLVGGATAGKLTIGQSTSCTTIITMGNSATAPNGWSCWVNDQTAIATLAFRQSATTTTTASFTGTGTSGDVLNFGCMGY